MALARNSFGAGAPVVHELFSVETLREAKAAHPGARVISHPECPKPIRDESDHVLGTAGMLKLVKASAGETFIVGTEANMIYRLRKEAPQNVYVPAPGALDLCGIEDRVDSATFDLLLRVDPQDWAYELRDQRVFYAKFGDRLPSEILRQHGEVMRRLGLDS